MGSKKVLVLDWDDTVNDTFSELHSQVGALPGPPVNPDSYLTRENTHGRLDVVLAEASFMGIWKPRPGMLQLTAAVITAAARGTEIVVCSHRGYHHDAAEKSKTALAQCRFPIHHIHWLNPDEHHDKVAYLDDTYGDAYILADDRPRYNDGSSLPRHILLMDQPWNKHIPVYSPQHRIDDVATLARYVVTHFT